MQRWTSYRKQLIHWYIICNSLVILLFVNCCVALTGIIYLRSHLGKYLSVNSYGNVLCETDERDSGSRFQISIAEDGSGRWALRNESRGYFLGGTPDELKCTAKVPSNSEFWTVHLAARPQVNAIKHKLPLHAKPHNSIHFTGFGSIEMWKLKKKLQWLSFLLSFARLKQVNLRSVGRKRFAHLSENQDEIHVDANIPWGEDTLFTLEFRHDEDGRYALHTCNNRYDSQSFLEYMAVIICFSDRTH